MSGFEEDENAGYSVRVAGDVNGDGYSDLLVGSMNADALLRPDSGRLMWYSVMKKRLVKRCHCRK